MSRTKSSITIVLVIVLTAILSTNISAAKAASSSAHAASLWTITDGFEGSLWDRWSCWHTVEDARNFCRASTHARTGVNAGYISGVSGWSDIRRWISVTPFMAGRNLSCAAQIYFYIRDLAIPDGFTAQLEVIDADTSQYISIKKVTSSTHGWQSITTSTWNPAHKNILVRLGTIGVGWTAQSADVDDLTVQCQYY